MRTNYPMRAYIGSDAALTFGRVLDKLTGTPVETATVQFQLWADDAPSTILAMVSLAHTGDGNYLGTLESADTALLDPQTAYTGQITAQDGSSYILKRQRVTATYAGFND